MEGNTKSSVLHVLSLRCLSNSQIELLRRQLEMSLQFSKEVRGGNRHVAVRGIWGWMRSLREVWSAHGLSLGLFNVLKDRTKESEKKQ